MPRHLLRRLRGAVAASAIIGAIGTAGAQSSGYPIGDLSCLDKVLPTKCTPLQSTVFGHLVPLPNTECVLFASVGLVDTNPYLIPQRTTTDCPRIMAASQASMEAASKLFVDSVSQLQQDRDALQAQVEDLKKRLAELESQKR